MSVPFSDQYQDVYFYRIDGLAEKRHVFLGGNDLPARFKGQNDFVIAEAGFGTGLSFLATAQAFLSTTTEDQHLHFYSFEAHPMAGDAIRTALNPWRAELAPFIDDLIDALPRPIPGWHRVMIKQRVTLTLIYGDINDMLPHFAVPVDAWYLDGFAPAKNPTMWSTALFAAMQRCSAAGATVATYSAARLVRDGFIQAEFDVQKQKGFGYKADMITGRFKGTERVRQWPLKNKHVAVLGGGLAATSVAWALKQIGHHPVLIAPHGLADGASGNARGLYNPRFAPKYTPPSEFYATAFARFHAFLKAHDPQETGWHASGALHLIRNDDTAAKLRGAVANWGWGEDDMRVIDVAAASDLAGIAVQHDALWLPHGGSVDPRKICALYARDIEVRPDLPSPHAYDAIVVANGLAACTYPGLDHLPLKGIRGQITTARATPASQHLNTHLCYGGYMTPSIDGQHTLGATFTRDDSGIEVRTDDHQHILQKLTDQVGPLLEQKDILDGRAGIRVTTSDHLPVIGPAPDNATIWISTAHGSHGLLSTHLGAFALVEQMSGTPSTLPDHLKNLVSPARFNPKSLK